MSPKPGVGLAKFANGGDHNTAYFIRHVTLEGPYHAIESVSNIREDLLIGSPPVVPVMWLVELSQQQGGHAHTAKEEHDHASEQIRVAPEAATAPLGVN